MAVAAEEFDLMKAIDYVAKVTAQRRKLVERDDVRQEVWVYALDEGKEDIDAAQLKGDTKKVFRLLFKAASAYAESVRADVFRGEDRPDRDAPEVEGRRAVSNALAQWWTAEGLGGAPHGTREHAGY